MASSSYYSKFIKTHLNKNIKNKKLLAVYKSNFLHDFTLTPQDNYVSRNLNFPPDLDRTRFEIVGSCGGLVALVRFQNPKVMFLINPTSSKYKKLPEMPLNLGVSKYGFGYDEYSDDFKIVRLSCYYGDKLDDNDTFVDVYSLTANCWTRIEVSTFYHISCWDASGVLLHGAIHWSVSTRTDYSRVIAAFDLSGEKLRGVEVPTDAKSSFNRLVVLDYCLCMISDDHQFEIDVWMMKEYGVQGSWIKLISVSYKFHFLIPGRLVGDLDFVVSNWETGEVEIFNWKEETFRSFVVDGAPIEFWDGCTFVESLVSPNPKC